MSNSNYSSSFLPQLGGNMRYSKQVTQPSLPANWQRQLQGLTETKQKTCPPTMTMKKQDFLSYRQPKTIQPARHRIQQGSTYDYYNDSSVDEYQPSSSRYQGSTFQLSQEQYNMLFNEQAYQQQQSQKITQQIQNYVNQDSGLNSLPAITQPQFDPTPLMQSSTLYQPNNTFSTQSHTKSNFSTGYNSTFTQPELDLSTDLIYNYFDDDDSNIEFTEQSINYLNYTKHRNDEQQLQGRPSSSQLIDQQFSELLIKEINIFCKSNAQNIKDAIITYKQYIMKHKKRTTINFKKIAARLGWEQKLCYQKYEGLQQKVLDKYTQAELQAIKQDVINFYQLNKEKLNYDKKRLNEGVKKYVYDKYKINLQFNKNQRQIHNLIIYQVNSMLRADQKY